MIKPNERTCGKCYVALRSVGRAKPCSLDSSLLKSRVIDSTRVRDRRRHGQCSFRLLRPAPEHGERGQIARALTDCARPALQSDLETVKAVNGRPILWSGRSRFRLKPVSPLAWRLA